MKKANAAASTVIIFAGAIAIAEPMPTNEVVTEMARVIDEQYVYPDTGREAKAMLLRNLGDGAYERLDGPALAQQLRADLQELTGDLHFGVRALPEGWTPPTDEQEQAARQAPRPPYGVAGVQRLDGNIGYIDLRGFANARYIEETVEAAMRLVQGSGSLIFDLRHNGGGDPHAVALISSYLFDPSEPVHLNSLYSRPDDTTTEYWTHAKISTELAMPDTPVYVLTSAGTFSAAEEFTYNLKNLGRATVIGETTGGGAHPVDSTVIGDRYVLIVPTARAISPITGTNWEGTGVTPHVQCPAGEALDAASARALEAAYADGDESALWGLAVIKARTAPIACSKAQMREYAGDYGPRHVRVHEGALQYRRDGMGSWRRLICFQPDRFVIEGAPGFIMEFGRDDQGRVQRIIGRYQQDHSDQSDRDA